MPNWCYNQTVFYGNKEKLKEIGEKLYKDFKKSLDKREDYNIINVLNAFGCPLNRFYGPNANLCVRAYVVDVYFQTSGELIISYESAWNPCYEVIDYVLKEYQPDIKQVTESEECSECIYVNTDKEGLFFKEKYYLDISLFGDEERHNDFKYFETLGEAIQEFKDFFELDVEIKTKEELKKIIRKTEDEYDELYITFAEFSPE